MPGIAGQALSSNLIASNVSTLVRSHSFVASSPLRGGYAWRLVGRNLLSVLNYTIALDEGVSCILSQNLEMRYGERPQRNGITGPVVSAPR